MEVETTAMKIDVLRNKHKLKDRQADFKHTYLRSSQSHCERLLNLNMRTILDELPEGNQYRITGNGRIVRKDIPNDMNRNIQVNNPRSNLEQSQNRRIQHHHNQEVHGETGFFHNPSEKQSHSNHHFPVTSVQNYTSSTPMQFMNGQKVFVRDVPHLNLSSMGERGSQVNANGSHMSSILGPPVFAPQQRLQDHVSTPFQTDSYH